MEPAVGQRGADLRLRRAVSGGGQRPLGLSARHGEQHGDDGHHPGPQNGTPYEVQVLAENSEGESEWSPSARGTPMSSASPPSRPASPTLTPGDGRLEVSWSRPSDNGARIFDYDVRYREVGSGPWDYRPDTANSTATTDIIPDLTNRTPYEVQVLAENSEGESDWSPSARGTPMSSASPPSRPAAPTLTPGDGRLEVSWSRPSDNGARIFDYDVRYREVGVGPWDYRPDTANSTATTDIIPDLTNRTPYEVQVLAENSEGESEWSPSARGTPMSSASPPSRPAPPTLTPGDGRLEVSWSRPSDNGARIFDYDVRYREVGSGPWDYRPDTANSTATTDIIPDLTNRTPYEVQVLAENSEGESDWSPSARGTPMSSASPPSRPASPTLTPGDGRLEVSWSRPSDNGARIFDYDVRYREVGSRPLGLSARHGEQHGDDGHHPGPHEPDAVRGSGSSGELGRGERLVSERAGHADVVGVPPLAAGVADVDAG